MLEGLSEFQALSRHNVAEFPAQPDEKLHFIIDTKRQPDALVRLYQAGEEFDLHFLYAQTDFSELASDGPVWFSAPRDSGLARLGMQFCLERQAGIVLSSSDEQAALAHARWLLRVGDLAGGESLIAFYLPAIWAALALTTDEHGALLGPWRRVFSPAPSRFEASGAWLEWSAPEAAAGAWSHQARYALSKTTPAFMRTLRWVYWIGEERAAFGDPTPERLPELIANLEALVEHRIYEGSHLLKLVDLIGASPITERPEVMSILRSPEEAFIKVERLQALPVAVNPN
jgi:hypothetical protein